MSAVALGVATALVALRCQLISDDPYVLGSVSRVLPSTRPAFLRALNQTRRLIGCPPEGDVPEPPSESVPGQCPGVRYSTTGIVRNSDGTVRTNMNYGCDFGFRGPVSAFIRDQPGLPGAFEVIIAARDANGSPTETQVTTVGPGATIENFQATRCDGLPDECGQLPPVYPPPTNITTNIDITYEGDDGVDITVNVPFVFAPITANFDGSLRIPITFDLGGFEFTGNINLPDFNLTINPPSIPPGSNSDSVGDDEPGETIEPAPPDEKIIGVVVNTTSSDSRRVSSYSSPGIPTIFAPRLGSVKFAYSIGAATFWSSDIDIKDGRTFIPCPFSQGADAVVASPQIGVNLSFVPIRGFAAATVADVRSQG